MTWPATLLPKLRRSNGGFTIVELILACVIFPMVVIGVTNTFISLRHSYMTARQLNEMYAVLSACPELDRALEFNSLSTGTNCYPNNTFQVEDTNLVKTNVYTPTLTVQNTTALPVGDPLQTIPDSKIVNIQVGFPPPNDNTPPLQLRILITRNGIGQM
jgi:Tfp pilus assembly protein PilW